MVEVLLSKGLNMKGGWFQEGDISELDGVAVLLKKFEGMSLPLGAVARWAFVPSEAVSAKKPLVSKLLCQWVLPVPAKVNTGECATKNEVLHSMKRVLIGQSSQRPWSTMKDEPEDWMKQVSPQVA